jgi:hypothetical protein
MDANIPVCFSVKTSAEWAASGLTILRGQPAFEVGDSDGKLLYILVGDGNPANVNPPGVSSVPPYRRLRVASATDVQKNLDSKYAEITASIAAARSEAKNALDAHAGLSEEAHEIPRQIDAKIAAFDVPGKIGAAVEAHAALVEDAHKIPLQIDDKIETHNEDPEAHEDIRGELGAKAPMENPVFSGTVDMRGAVAEVSQPRDNAAGPYANSGQPVTVKDFLDISSLTIESAGEYLREYDNDGSRSQFEYLKIVDRAAGKYLDAETGAWVAWPKEAGKYEGGGAWVSFFDEYRKTDADAVSGLFEDAVWVEADLPAASDYFENAVWV